MADCQGEEAKSPMELYEKLNAIGDKVRSLKAAKAEKVSGLSQNQCSNFTSSTYSWVEKHESDMSEKAKLICPPSAIFPFSIHMKLTIPLKAKLLLVESLNSLNSPESTHYMNLYNCLPHRL